MCHTVIFLVSLLTVTAVWCCRGGGGGGGGGAATTTETPEDAKESSYEDYDRGNRDWHKRKRRKPLFSGPGPDSPDWKGRGWGYPPGADNMGIYTGDNERYKGMKWGAGGLNRVPGHQTESFENHDTFPENWRGIGGAYVPRRPPPWAYVPNTAGKPLYCSLPPVRGRCPEGFGKYGYHPYLDTCAPFPFFAGCEGNENNFKSKERCEDLCAGDVGPDCADSDEPEFFSEELG